jgi:hypothetical protein
MMVPHHNIHKTFLIISQVFHRPYYQDRAHVKCSLSRSDGDTNRFLTSWRACSPHKPHSLIKWATDHRITLYRTNSRVRQAPLVPEDRFVDRGIQGIPRLHTAPSSFSSKITNTTRTSSRFLAQIVLRLHGRNDLSFQLSVGMRSTWQEGRQWSVLNRHRQGHYGQLHHKTLTGLKFIPTLGYFSQQHWPLIIEVSTYISQVTRNHLISTVLSKLSIDSEPTT